jgi:hypothetical protein
VTRVYARVIRRAARWSAPLIVARVSARDYQRGAPAACRPEFEAVRLVRRSTLPAVVRGLNEDSGVVCVTSLV